ncbi:hypothetical protein ACLOJK_015915 [Asimina triloba]
MRKHKNKANYCLERRDFQPKPAIQSIREVPNQIPARQRQIVDLMRWNPPDRARIHKFSESKPERSVSTNSHLEQLSLLPVLINAPSCRCKNVEGNGSALLARISRHNDDDEEEEEEEEEEEKNLKEEDGGGLVEREGMELEARRRRALAAIRSRGDGRHASIIPTAAAAEGAQIEIFELW